MAKQKSIDEAVEQEVVEQEVVEETALVESTGTELSTDYEEEGEEFESEDDTNSIPNLIIIQKSHDDKLDHLGELYSPELDMYFESMKCSLLLRYDTRVMFPDEYDKDNMPLCRSNDGKYPAQMQDEDGNNIPMLGTCCDWDKSTLGKRGVRPKRQCSYANWTEDAKGHHPPACNEVVNLILLDMETEIPYRFSLKSTTLAPLKTELTKPMGYRKMALSAKRKKAGMGKSLSCMFSFELSINPEDKKSSKGSSKIPMFANIQELSQEEIEHNLEWRSGIIPYVEMLRSSAPVTQGSESETHGGGDTGSSDDEDF